ncbi:MAG: MerR family DNA-binding transcriptional regulator [Phycisphaerales bacterium]
MKQLLSPKQVAAAIGVSESTLKRWADEGIISATRTAGGHRRIPVAEAVRFVRETQARIVDPSILGLKDLLEASEAPAPGDRVEQMYTVLTEGRADRVRGLMLSMFLEGTPVASLCDQVIVPSMRRIGELWHEQKDGIFVEHRATDLVLQGMNHVQSLIDVPDDAPPAVGGGAPGDPYLLPSLMACVSLRDAGVRAVNLGPDTPAASILHAIDHCRARLAWMSVTGNPIPTLREDVAGLVHDVAARGATLVVGGRELNRVSFESHPQLYIGADMGALVAFSRGALMSGSTSSSSLEDGNGVSRN